MSAKTQTEINECPQHGPLKPRPKERQTPEQLWCGEWFDCEKCRYTSLVRSPELIAQLNEQLKSLKADYDRLRTKCDREKFLKYCNPEVVSACVNGVFLS
jgi:hypothetical protein